MSILFSFAPSQAPSQFLMNVSLVHSPSTATSANTASPSSLFHQNLQLQFQSVGQPIFNYKSLVQSARPREMVYVLPSSLSATIFSTIASHSPITKPVSKRSKKATSSGVKTVTSRRK